MCLCSLIVYPNHVLWFSSCYIFFDFFISLLFFYSFLSTVIWLSFSLWCLIVFSHMLCHITLRWIGAVSPAGGWQIEKNKSDIWAKLDFLSTNNTKKNKDNIGKLVAGWKEQVWHDKLDFLSTNSRQTKKTQKNINKQTNKQTIVYFLWGV